MTEFSAREDGGQRVVVRGLEVSSKVGVPDEEREQRQRLLIDLEVVALTPFDELNDDIDRAVDYHALVMRVQDVAQHGERRLIETLAVDVAAAALADAQVDQVTVRIRKFILPETEFVAVELTRRREGTPAP